MSYGLGCNLEMKTELIISACQETVCGSEARAYSGGPGHGYPLGFLFGNDRNQLPLINQ